MNHELLQDIYEALDEPKKWLHTYELLLRVCKTKAEAKEALIYLIKLDRETNTNSNNTNKTNNTDKTNTNPKT